ncbi:FkbM family methyltransferase [Tateyamaria omphalii]|uniref:FkbM family methyltransferase n=1 Tax=Tateyamaria omphalii TaxID=299262 RepID=UPI001C993CCD|nr:FkbM family methyltransferase [Tateyamaria omphalii]MBY5932175.1 FkbM family methyltransferase [Tateyamaria omphalii]
MTPEITRIQKRLRLGRPVQAENVQLTHTSFRDRRIVFCTNMENDPIQRNHRKGSFYELSELKEIEDVFPDGGTFVDIGANVGNHTLYAAAFLKASRVIPIEPNPAAYRLLIQNVLLNGLDDIVDFSHLGIGLSDSEERGYAVQKRTRNLGAARLQKTGKGGLTVVPADEVLKDETPDFIKIDVEGMEMKVLAGLQDTAARCRPNFMVEVDLENDDAFHAWCASSGYEVASCKQRYKQNRNYLLKPV